MPDYLAQVALNIPKENLFSYVIPSHLSDIVKPGHLVCVPLRKREAIGLVVKVNDAFQEDSKRMNDLKEILALPYPEPILDQRLLELARWISDYYLCPLGITVRALIPTGVIPERILNKLGDEMFRPKGKEKRIFHLSIAKSDGEIRQYITTCKKRTPRQSQILTLLLERGGKAAISDLFPNGPIPYSLINTMVEKGLLKRTQGKAFRAPSAFQNKTKTYHEIILTADQEKVLVDLYQSLDQGGFSPFLLHGITGSGKTEVYLRLILRALEKDLQAIILVPEISITHQLIDRFRYYLGDRIAILHSHLSDGERLDEWLRVKQGLADVVIGARSAVFAPLSRLGVIICDEEHDPSYKQESSPRYHGRDVAIMRAKMTPCLICLGSATPSLESYYNAQIKKYRLLALPKRVTPHPTPFVRMIDMRDEYDPKEKGSEDATIFSEKLLEAMDETILKGSQTLIFQNRRGYAPFLLCPKCGYVPKCPNCSVSLTFHATDGQLRCHYCDYQNRPPQFCPHCPEVPLQYIGHGTQKLEQLIKKMFPDAAVSRMDRDTTTRKGAHHRILNSVEKGEIDILVGTQMITKGLDLPKVVMVGVIGIDHILNLPDFRSTERVFQLITQVAGRAGRGDEPGKVFVQTFHPHHYSFSFASRHDYESFYRREIGFRKQLKYPPFSRLVSLIIKGKDRKKTRQAGIWFSKAIRSNIKPNEVRVLGPAMAPLFRLRGKYRYQIMLKALDYRIAHLAIHQVFESISSQNELRGVHVEVDVDPVNLL